mmetsp:Transcript_13411/g.27367  ORF Transcript_13411/g.27367 Transcript_13411/m.27367 type:complete len:182 (+) Transcript_13411:170-715(+)
MPQSPPPRVPKLSDLVLQSILKSPRPEVLVALLDDDFPNVLKEEEKQSIRNKLCERFPYLREKYDSSTLRSALGSSFYDRLENLFISSEEEKHRFRASTRSGSVLSPRSTGWEGVVVYDDTKLPYLALKQGAAFPEGVDVKNREKYLSDAEFEKVLGFTKEEWGKLDRYKKIEHKKKTLLF